MKMKRREFTVFTAGVLSLGGLGGLIARKLRMPVPVTEEAADGFELPPGADKAVHRFEELVFSVDRARKTVCAHNEATGELVWESHGESRFIVPGAAFPLDLSPEGELWVANIGKKRLEQLDPKTGRFIASWEPRETFGGCCNPVRFAALPGGRFVTMEKGVRRAAIYSPSGALEKEITDELSNSEFNYFLSRAHDVVQLYDTGVKRHWEVRHADFAP